MRSAKSKRAADDHESWPWWQLRSIPADARNGRGEFALSNLGGRLPTFFCCRFSPLLCGRYSGDAVRLPELAIGFFFYFFLKSESASVAFRRFRGVV